MLRVGLTGPTGAGKSTVSEIIRTHGIPVIDADRVAHDLYVPGSKTVAELAEAFGEEILTDDGGVDRAALGRIVFGDPKQLAKLGKIVHPRLLEKLEGSLDALDESGEPVVVVEAALLLRWGELPFIDRVVGVLAPRERRRERLIEAGLPVSVVAMRLDAQIDDATVRDRAHTLLVNDGDLEALEAAVDAMIREWETSSRRSDERGGSRERGE